MNTLKNQVIDKIIKLLTPLRSTYPEEINDITNELINNKYGKLILFVNTHFDKLKTSQEIVDLVNNLIDLKLIDNSFIDKIKNNNYEFIPIKESNILFVDSKPLNVKENKLKRIIKNSPTPKLEKINHEYFEVKLKEINKEKDLEYQESTNVDDLRKKILDAQLNYINNAAGFIKNLESKDEKDMYQSLIELNDIRFIQHSLSKMSKYSLDRLLPYVESRLEEKKHISIDMFIIEVIKKYLHTKMR